MSPYLFDNVAIGREMSGENCEETCHATRWSLFSALLVFIFFELARRSITMVIFALAKLPQITTFALPCQCA